MNRTSNLKFVEHKYPHFCLPKWVSRTPILSYIIYIKSSVLMTLNVIRMSLSLFNQPERKWLWKNKQMLPICSWEAHKGGWKRTGPPPQKYGTTTDACPQKKKKWTPNLNQNLISNWRNRSNRKRHSHAFKHRRGFFVFVFQLVTHFSALQFWSMGANCWNRIWWSQVQSFSKPECLLCLYMWVCEVRCSRGCLGDISREPHLSHSKPLGGGRLQMWQTPSSETLPSGCYLWPRSSDRGKEHIQSTAAAIKETNELDLFPAARLGEPDAAETVDNLWISSSVIQPKTTALYLCPE